MASSEKCDFFFSRLLGKKIFDRNGRVIGKILDIAVRWIGAHPVATSIRFTKGRLSHFDAAHVNKLTDAGLFLNSESAMSATTLSDDSIYVSKWLLDKQIIDRTGARLVRVNDIKLTWINREITLTAVDIGIKGLFRRLGLEWLVKSWPEKYVDWERIIPLENQYDNLKLRGDILQAQQFLPAEMAGIIEQLTHYERLRMVDNFDDQFLAKVLVTLSPKTKGQLFSQLDEGKAVKLLSTFPPNESASLLRTLPQPRSAALLKQVVCQNPAIKSHLSYPPDTAGALMITEFATFPADITAAAAIQCFQRPEASGRWLYYVYIIDAAKTLQGICSIRKLLAATPNVYLEEIMQKRLITLPLTASRKEIAETFLKFRLLAIPIVDDKGAMVGLITPHSALSPMEYLHNPPILPRYADSLRIRS